MRVGNFSKALIAFVTVFLGTVSAAECANREPIVAIVAVNADLSQPVEHDAILEFTVSYNIKKFKAKTFYLSPQFVVSESRSINPGAGPQQRVYLEAASGKATVKVDLAAANRSTEVKRPLELRILLLKGTEGKNTSHSVGASKTILIRSK